jgi:EmrB/QacA subfamily drug resistance transporter
VDSPIAAGTAQGRWVLTAAVLGSSMALLDGTVVNVALRTIGEDLDASVAQLQWVVNAYLLTLASLILVGGSLGDRLGRRRVFLVGVAWFTAASVLCAVAPGPGLLITARLVQGVGAALLTPGSLAVIQASFRPADRAAVIGRWAGLGGIAAAAGPLLGGWIIDVASWRWLFWLNVPLGIAVLLVTARHVPESRDPEAAGRFDAPGAGLAVLGLGGLTYALVESGTSYAVPAAAVGVVGLAAFLAVQHRSAAPLMPLGLFRERVFSVANAMTLLVYGALGAVTFFLVLQLQSALGYSPLQAGVATIPITVMLLFFSSRAGAVGARIGPRLPMSIGPMLCALGSLMLSRVAQGSGYLGGVLPGLLVFSVGLVTLVAPLTATVLAAAPDRLAGVASGVNNAVARTGSLLAVAALPALVGIGGDDYQQPAIFTDGYAQAMLVCAGLLVGGGLVSFVGLRGGRAVAAAPG